MKRNYIMIYKYLKLNKLLTLLLVMSSFSLLAQVSPEAGKTLFKNNCATCHAKNMMSDATGPALAGFQDRWDNEADIYAWIRNSQAMIFEVANPRAVELWDEFKPNIMTAFPGLTDDEIGSILAYVTDVVENPVSSVVAVSGEPVKEKSSNWIYIILAGLLGLLALILSSIINNLDVVSAAKEGRVIGKKTLFQTLTSKGIVGFLIFGLIVLAGYTTASNAVNLGRQQGYMPDQPIKFSHVTHAGIHKIDCQYCHDGARRSKHSVIPAANTCMNCHAAIKTGSTYGTAELTKIYASIGFDPTSGKYLEDYENISDEDYKAIYTKWIGDQYKDKNELADLDFEGDAIVADQWDDIVSSLTNEQKKKVQGPIEWTRVHNLPDHVYFNHAQHVSVGKVECKTCHGDIEKMPVVQQHSPLSMGWCINCHRQTKVQFDDNEYYKSYSKYHEDLKSGAMEKVTVADIGGLECQKCHY